MDRQNVESDVLCVGGGPAGLMAAIRASDLGAKVILAEKGNTLRSGAAATGNDHLTCYVPEIHGDMDRLVRAGVSRGIGRHAAHVRALYEKSFEVARLWEEWGIPIKYKGQYEFTGHAYPGSSLPPVLLRIHGENLKKVLTKKAQQNGVKIMNRVMVSDLVREDGIIGAVGVHTREKKLITFKARSVVLGTGMLTRLYPGPTPGWIFNIGRCPATTGDGRAMAYRAGAELVNLEIPIRWAGPKYLVKHGKATWVGVLRDPHGNPVGPFVTRPDRKYGDATSDIYTTLFEDYMKTGKGPVYMDCGGISDEDWEYMLHWFRQEGLTSFLDYFDKENIDPRKNPVEFTTYEILPMGGVYFNEKGETSLKGLYGGGDEFQGFSLAGAAVYGWIAGGNAAEYAKGISDVNPDRAEAKAAEWARLIEGILRRESGASWKEVNLALQQIMNDYAGTVRSDTLLQAGLHGLRRLKEKAYGTMMAANQHELTRVLEVLNLLDLGELIFIMALERKETRGRHLRTDYPYANPLMEKMLVVKKVDGQAVTEWRAIER